jgi:peptidoglycan/LPS O-acetylase OafA/YrhL
MDRLFSETIFGIPWIALATIALVIAVVYVVIDTGASADGLRWIVLRWFHPLCWLFLASAALARSKVTPLPVDWAGALGAIGGLLYLVFAIIWVTRGQG